jgi:hypothetical protein
MAFLRVGGEPAAVVVGGVGKVQRVRGAGLVTLAYPVERGRAPPPADREGTHPRRHVVQGGQQPLAERRPVAGRTVAPVPQADRDELGTGQHAQRRIGAVGGEPGQHPRRGVLRPGRLAPGTGGLVAQVIVGGGVRAGRGDGHVVEPELGQRAHQHRPAGRWLPVGQIDLIGEQPPAR